MSELMRIDTTILPGTPFAAVVMAGEFMRLIDLEGNQAVDTILYDARRTSNRYSAADTIRRQSALFLTTGSQLLSCEGDVLMTIVDDTCGRHDTVGGACSAESNVCRFGEHTRYMHNCRDNFLHGLAPLGMGKADIVPNINFFMNVPVTADGRLDIVDGISQPGAYVELRAEMDTLVVISNCPQINNPCNGWNPTAVRVIVRAAP